MTFNGTKFQLTRQGKNEDLMDETTYFTDKMEDVLEQFDNLKKMWLRNQDKNRLDS